MQISCKLVCSWQKIPSCSFYCTSPSRITCNLSNQLYDTDYGGTSIGLWLQNLQENENLPIKIINQSKKIIHLTDLEGISNVMKKILEKRLGEQKFERYKFCNEKIVFHKANGEMIEDLWVNHSWTYCWTSFFFPKYIYHSCPCPLFNNLIVDDLFRTENTYIMYTRCHALVLSNVDDKDF